MKTTNRVPYRRSLRARLAFGLAIGAFALLAQG
jgi:hypothetical protein